MARLDRWSCKRRAGSVEEMIQRPADSLSDPNLAHLFLPPSRCPPCTPEASGRPQRRLPSRPATGETEKPSVAPRNRRALRNHTTDSIATLCRSAFGDKRGGPKKHADFGGLPGIGGVCRRCRLGVRAAAHHRLSRSATMVRDPAPVRLPFVSPVSRASPCRRGFGRLGSERVTQR